MTTEELVWRLAQLLVVAGGLLFVVLRFPETFRRFVMTIRKLKWGPLELERAVDAGAEAVIQKEHRDASKAELHRDLQRLPRAKILWVDDNPGGNRSEIEALEHAGLVVDTVRSNEEAIQRVRGREYDLVLSDIGRESPESERAGLDLPRQLMPDRNRVPPVIYYVTTVKALYTPDGYPVTNRPSKLFRLIGDVLRWKA